MQLHAFAWNMHVPGKCARALIEGPGPRGATGVGRTGGHGRRRITHSTPARAPPAAPAWCTAPAQLCKQQSRTRARDTLLQHESAARVVEGATLAEPSHRGQASPGGGDGARGRGGGVGVVVALVASGLAEVAHFLMCVCLARAKRASGLVRAAPIGGA